MVTLPRECMCVLVADDEAPARQRLIDLLRKDCDVATILELLRDLPRMQTKPHVDVGATLDLEA